MFLSYPEETAGQMETPRMAQRFPPRNLKISLLHKQYLEGSSYEGKELGTTAS